MIRYAIYVMNDSWSKYHGHTLSHLLNEGITPEMYMYDRRTQGTVKLDKITDDYLLNDIIIRGSRRKGCYISKAL